MKRQSIVITERDMERLSRLVRVRRSLLRDQQELNLLENVLQNAEVRPIHSAPKCVVRMMSRVQVRDVYTRKEDVYAVVFPDEANAFLGLISVLAPIGIALLGRRKGAVVDVKVPVGIRKLRILGVVQSPDSSTKNIFSVDRQTAAPVPTGEERIAA